MLESFGDELARSMMSKMEEDIEDLKRPRLSPRGWWSRLMWRFIRFDVTPGLGCTHDIQLVTKGPNRRLS